MRAVMRTTMLATLALAGGLPAPAVRAQGPAATVAPDAAKLAKARALIALMHLDNALKQGLRANVAALAGRMNDGMLAQMPGGAEALRKDPQAGEKFRRAMEAMMPAMVDEIATTLPDYLDAAAKAYARQLTDAELDAATAYYRSPAGQGLLRKLPALMSDPAITAAQLKALQRISARMPELVAKASTAAGLPAPATPAP